MPTSGLSHHLLAVNVSGACVQWARAAEYCDSVLARLYTIFPAVINDLFIPTSTIHAHNTRSSQKLFVQGTRTSAAASCIRHTGVKIWNKISTIILLECSLPTFKYCVRDYLLSFKLDW